MPPKDAKGKGKGAPVVKTVDPQEYLRPATALPAVTDSMTIEMEKCKIKNTETLFPEWSGVDAEPWGEAFVAEVNVALPAYLATEAKKVSSKSFFGLDVEAPVDPKAKAPPAKKDAKKGAAGPVEVKDEEANEAGIKLPRIYIDTEECKFDGYSFSHPLSLRPNDNVNRVDEVLCSAFEFVSHFAKNIATVQADGNANVKMEFLWRSIYPKSPQGKPCYNPAGKYFVRLFLAGKWRKIPVDDAIPLSEDGSVVLASSSNKYELWPIIISKAIYLVMNKCGYNLNMTQLSSKEAGSIFAFVVHLLTGWAPSSPLQVERLWSNSIADLGALFQEMLSYKVALFESGDIPEDLSAILASIPSDVISVDEKAVMKTKKQLKEDFQQQKTERDLMEQRILSRESKIVNIQQSISVPVFEASFLSFIDSESNSRLLPILGINYPDSSIENLSILVKYKIGEKVESNSKQGEGSVPSWKVQLPALPPCTSIDSVWISLKDILQFNPYLVSIDTRLIQEQEAKLDWRWKPPAPAAEDPKAAKDKGKKGAAEAPKEAASDAPSEDCGQLPPMLLSIDTKSLVPQEGSEVPIPTHIPLSIFIHADTFENSGEGLCNIKDNVVLILQEFGSYSEGGPLLMRIELSAQSIIPITRTTFQIPTNRIPTGKPFLFLIRMFTSASAFITVHSSLPLNLGHADEVWRSAGMNSYSFNGDAVTTKPGAENVLFRLPLSLETPEAAAEGGSEAESSERVYVFLHIAHRKLSELVTLLSIPRLGSAEQLSFPSSSGAIIELKAKDLVLLVGSLSSHSLSTNVPGFSWKITVLSTPKLSNLSLFNNTPGTQLYSGTYNGNNKLCLFNELYSVDKASFPLALKVSVESLSEFFTQENIWITFVVKRKSDRKIISEYSGRGIIPVYYIELAGLIDENAAAAPVDPKAKKDDKKGGKGAPAIEAVDLLLECRLDETKMPIPLEWRTKYPHYFDLKLAPCVANIPPVIKWSVNVLSGTVASVTHDIAELERQAALKNQWEEQLEGRSERAAAAALAYQQKRALYLKLASSDINNGTDEGFSQIQTDVDVLADSICTAVGAETKDSMKEKQRSIFSSKEFKEIISPLPSDSSSKEVLDEAAIQKYKDTFTEAKNQRESVLDTYQKSLASLNESFRNATKSRSAAIINDSIANSNELAEVWSKRETYRNHTIKYNTALKFLVDKGSEVVQAEQDKEDEANGIKKDKKGGKKK